VANSPLSMLTLSYHKGSVPLGTRYR